MKNFATLYHTLEFSSADGQKLALFKDYLNAVSQAEAAWAIYLLCGKRIKTGVKNSDLRVWAQEFANVSDWLFEESLQIVQDLNETISLILPPAESSSDKSLDLMLESVLNLLPAMEPSQRKQAVVDSWKALSDAERLVFNRIVTGTLRTVLPQNLIVTALSENCGTDKLIIAQKLQDSWQASEDFLAGLRSAALDTEQGAGASYPFCPVAALAAAIDILEADPSKWLFEWKWDGLRAQLIKRNGVTVLWSCNEEILNERFPDLLKEAAKLPDGVVLEGEIVAWKDADVLPFHFLQQRLTSKSGSGSAKESIAVAFMAYDLLEDEGADIRQLAVEKRKERLADLLNNRNRSGSSSPAEYEQLKLFAPCSLQLSSSLRLSPSLTASCRGELQELWLESGKIRASGLLCKAKGSAYACAAPAACPWLHWQAEPFVLDMVLVAVQKPGRLAAGPFVSCSFALWQQDELLSFARTAFDMTELDKLEVESFVRENTLERYGPVRLLKPELVFEVSFEGVQAFTRYKSGLAARGARVVRRKAHKSASEADSLEKLKQLLETR